MTAVHMDLSSSLATASAVAAQICLVRRTVLVRLPRHCETGGNRRLVDCGRVDGVMRKVGDVDGKCGLSDRGNNCEPGELEGLTD